MKVRTALATGAVAVGLAGALTGSAIGDTIPSPPGGEQPLASGQLFSDNAHGVLHCQRAAELIIDPNIAPGSAPGAIVVSPNGFVFGGPRDGICADLYTALTGTQP